MNIVHSRASSRHLAVSQYVLGVFRPCRLLIDVNEKQQRDEKMRTKMSLLRMQNIFGLPAAHVQMPKQKGPHREKGKITACHIKVAI